MRSPSELTARLLDAAHQWLGGPVVLVLNRTRLNLTALL
jgi:hypothetical protein